MRRYINITLLLFLLLSTISCNSLTLEEQFEKELRSFRFQKCQVLLQELDPNIELSPSFNALIAEYFISIGNPEAALRYAALSNQYDQFLEQLRPNAPSITPVSGAYDLSITVNIKPLRDNLILLYSLDGESYLPYDKTLWILRQDTKIYWKTINEFNIESHPVETTYIINTLEEYLDDGQTAYSQGNIKLALEKLEHALKISESSSQIHQALIDIYTEQNDTKNLMRILTIASHYSENSEYDERLLALLPQLPVLDRPDGNYDSAITVKLSQTSQHPIYYTTDGSDPTKESPLFEQGLSLQKGIHNIKLISISDEGVQSDIADYAYRINQPDQLMLYRARQDIQFSLYMTPYKSVTQAGQLLYAPKENEQVHSGRFSPNGEEVAFIVYVYTNPNFEKTHDTYSKVLLIDLDTMEITDLYETDAFLAVSDLTWKDQDTLIFAIETLEFYDDGRQELYEFSRLKQSLVQITHDNLLDDHPYFYNGKLYYEHRTVLDLAFSSEIMMMEAKNSRVTNLINDENPDSMRTYDAIPVPNYDESKIAFGTHRYSRGNSGYDRDLAYVNTRDGNIYRMTKSNAHYWPVRWIDNDTILTVVKRQNDLKSYIAIIDTDGRETIVLKSDAYDYFPLDLQ